MASVPERIAWAVAQLRPGPKDRIVEIGCGGGLALALLAEQATGATIVGIDRSAAQVARARARLSGIQAGQRPDVHALSLADAASRWADEPFDRVLAVNVNAFWVTPEKALAALGTLLAPRGMACLAYEPPSLARADRLARDLPPMLQRQGFRVAAVRAARFRTGHGACFLIRHGRRGRLD